MKFPKNLIGKNFATVAEHVFTSSEGSVVLIGVTEDKKFSKRCVAGKIRRNHLFLFYIESKVFLPKLLSTKPS